MADEKASVAIDEEQEQKQNTEEDSVREKLKNLEFILDIPLRVSVELGRTRMVINDLLRLGQGSVIELAKMAGEPLEVLVNDKLIARGEVVVVNDKFGVRLTDIISPVERIEQLK
jgi:flagellar motor switch protein FliN/FliY